MVLRVCVCVCVCVCVGVCVCGYRLSKAMFRRGGVKNRQERKRERERDKGEKTDFE